MKKYIIILLIACIASPSLYAQTTTKKKKKKKANTETVVQKPLEIALPPRSADCLFPVKLMLDSAFGPTEPLQGPGFVSDIKRDAQTKNIFEQEHNTVWYKLDCPYDGRLIIDITPKSELDDYDFLVYKYTDQYFCNRLEKNRVKPVRSVMSAVNGTVKGATGLSLKGTAANISKNSTDAYAKYIDVKTGESYIIVLDNLQDGGLGHTIKAEIYTEHHPLFINPVDSLAKQRTTANIRVKDCTTDIEILNVQDAGSTKIKLLPKKEYDIFITKNGFFNYYRHISYEDATDKDTILTARLSEIKVGSAIPLKGDLYFDEQEDGTIVLLPECKETLNDLVKLLLTYPNINVEVVGRITTNGLDLRKDNENSKKRAEAIKDYLVAEGVPEMSISTRGSSNKELLKQIENQNKLNTTIFPKCEVIIKSLK